ncbi:MAG: hypothetical protein H3C28_04125 [Sphingomonadales bacterium]|nr:hypothetical protein [Sphingomonadales bacterium]
MARKSAPSAPQQPEAAPSAATALTLLAARYLDFWQRNLLAWSNDISLPPLEKSKDD